ncbi:serpin family protein [Streptomyces sp. NBC_01262]|uniref:serpin family protein n=1 Tax=Streptomyces sp. NBC_01262 TaxID=2903803 RepID=UPI002E30516E|nr:serpin family protein [Streptomyces sp. NBC_01262]
MAQDALTGHAGAIQELACRWLPIVAGGSGEGGGDFACSPAGLWLALAAAAAGAGGETAEELRKLLGTAGPEAAGAVTEAARAVAGTDAVAVATGVWARTPVYRSYRESLPDIGFGQLDPADLSAIDDWVREATGGLIERLPAEPGPGTLLLLVNAIVLRARWAEPFEPHATHHRPFTDASGVREPVPTMWKRVPLADAWTVGASRVVELRCRADGGRPGARVRFVLGEPGREAGAVLADAWAAPALRGPVDAEEVEISLPRLSLRTRLEVTDHLAALGIARSASDAADFSVMSPERLKIGEVAQEAVLRIAEKGVEAAAATLVAMAPGGAAPVRRVERIRFDRPFGIVVLDAAGEVPLFTAWQAAVPRDPLPGPYELTEHDPDPDAVRRITFVPFLPDGRCALIDDGDLVLPSGEVLPGEHWLLDTSVRVPMETAGFRPQRVHPFAYDAERQHLFVWLEGDRYTGPRPHADAALVAEPPEALAGVLLPGTDLTAALDAARSYRAQSDASYFADNVRLLEPAYLRAGTPEGGSGFGGGPQEWRARRSMIVEGLHRDGTFLDLGCANGLLMESVREWAAERGRSVEPYGIDLAPGLVALARRRLPHWADRIEEGNALDWRPADGRRFTFVHVLADCVPRARLGELIRHVRGLAEPGGRVLLSVYQPTGGGDVSAAERMAEAGIWATGAATGDGPPGTATTAWIDA